MQPGIGLTTDFIVGFPGETEEDFEQTQSLVRDVGFDQAYVFRYSERRDTPAVNMPGQVPQTVREERHHRLLTLVNATAAPRYQALVGRRAQVLVEGPSKNNEQRLPAAPGATRSWFSKGLPATSGR